MLRLHNTYTYCIKLSLILALCFWRLDAYSEYYPLRNFSEDDGFVQNEIYSIGQDKDGLIYLATDMGLYLYDGIRFKLLKNDPRVDNNVVLGIMRLNDEINVCQTLGGKVYYIKNGKVISWLIDDLIGEMDIRGVSIARKINSTTAMVTCGFSRHFYILNFDERGLKNKKKINLPEGFKIAAGDADASGCWFICDSACKPVALYYDHEKSTYDHIPIPFDNISRVERTGDSTLIIHGDGLTGFYTVKGPHLKLRKRFFGWNINNTLTDYSGDIWICSSDGLRHIVNDTITETYFSGMVVNTIFQDRDSNLWVGTVGNGVFLLTPRKGRLAGRFQKNHTFCITGNGDVKLFGGRNRIGLINAQSEISFYELEEDIKRGRGFINDMAFVDSNHVALAGDQGIFMINIHNNSVHNRKNLRVTAGKAVIWDGEKLWCGTHADLGYFEKKSGLHRTIKETRVYALERDDEGMIWCASQSGLFKVEATSPHRILNISSDSCLINDLLYRNEKMFVATTCGSYYLDKSNHATKTWIIEGINCLKLDAYEDKLVFATPFGLYCYAQINGKYRFLRNYGKEQGLVSNIINDIQIDGDSIWVVTSKGINVLPWQTSNCQKPRNVNILSVSSLGTGLKPSAPIRLNSDSRQLSIEFASAVFGQTPLYEYRFLPNSSKWIKTEDNKLVFSKLNPGSYTFEVRNLVEGNGSVGPVSSLNISVVPEIYETNLFRLFLIVIVVLSIIVFTIFRVNEINRRQYEKSKREQRLNQLELEAIKAQMNPHFIHNCLNSIHFAILKKQEDAAQQVASFSRLMRTTMDFSRLDIVSMEEEVYYLEQYLLMEKLRFKETLQYKITRTGVDMVCDKIPTMMIQPFIENSIKHGMVPGRALLIELNFENANGVLICTIEDNGRGFNPARRKMKKELHGITLSRARAEMYNKIYNYNISIEISDKRQIDPTKEGAKVVVTIPSVKAPTDVRSQS